MRTAREANSLPAARSRFLEAWLEEGDADAGCKVHVDPVVRAPRVDRRVHVDLTDDAREVGGRDDPVVRAPRVPRRVRVDWRGDAEADPWVDRRVRVDCSDDVEVSCREDAALNGGEPPENALQGLQGRVLSEHELRVQRSLQQLNVPDWYKNSSRPAEGFLLKRGSDATSVAGRRGAGGWPGLGVKTTSLSSLRSPTTAVRLGSSPSPPPAAFTRWSSSRLHSAGSASATPSTSPCGSARSSFNHRQPYLGWRSQERLSGTPRTPAERLAQGLLEQREHQRQQERLRGSSQLQSSSPNLSDVRSSIKEVTSAIVHYVSAANDPGSNTDVRLAGHSPAPSTATNTSRDREDHPRSHSGHSNQRVCWIESSFVGSRPIEQPQTPEEGSVSTSPLPVHHQDLYLDLKQRNSSCATGASGTLPSNGPATVPGHGHGAHQSHGVAAAAAGTAAEVESPASPVAAAASGPSGPCGLNAVVSRPSPSSTTMEDVLDSLLGLPPPSRSPSPGPNTNTASNASNGSSSSQQVSCTAATAVTQVQVQSAQHQGHQGHQASLRTCADIRPDPAGRRTVVS